MLKTLIRLNAEARRPPIERAWREAFSLFFDIIEFGKGVSSRPSEPLCLNDSMRRMELEFHYAAETTEPAAWQTRKHPIALKRLTASL